MKVHNFMEQEVNNLLPILLKEYPDICKCELCISDIKAIALNNLVPHYFSTEKGELYTKVGEMSAQFSVDVYKELIKAIEIVKKKPHHDK